jgi:hypothetical protein
MISNILAIVVKILFFFNVILCEPTGGESSEECGFGFARIRLSDWSDS